MQTISELLRRTRLEQGVHLGTVAAATRIDAKYLRAIEADDLKRFPGTFFYKSFVHQYAMSLGLDTIAIDAEVDRVLSTQAPLPLPGIVRESAEKVPFHSRPVAKYLSVAALVLVFGASIGLDAWWHKTPATARVAATPVHQESVVPARPTAPAVVASAPRQEAPKAPAGSKVELALTAKEDTWLSVSSDGTTVFSGILEANQTKTIEGKETANLKVGNAAGLDVRLNGTPLGSLGAHGQVRDLAFTSDKFRFVSQPSQND
jgi:cytoskeleton protein RodZ